MKNLTDKVIFITGATRGVGEALALRCASEGATIIVTGKTKDHHPTLPGTLDEVCEKIEVLGGKALSYQLDVRDDVRVGEIIREVGEKFGHIDVLANNAGAIYIATTEDIPMKRFDLLMDVNVRGTFACTQAALPYLRKAENPHIVNLSPPMSWNPRWLKFYLAYTLSKYSVSLCTLGWANEFKKDGIAVNSLWPSHVLATMAVKVNFGQEIFERARLPTLTAEAFRILINYDSKEVTGNFFTDEEILTKVGITDFSGYAVNKNTEPYPDLFLDE